MKKTIQIGREEWSYEIEGDYTHIWDPDDVHAVVLRWASSEKEITAAAYGYGSGCRHGVVVGGKKKLEQIKAVLEIP